jgi:hypothetical protein
MGEAASAWRDGLVRPLLAAYAATPEVAAVALSGSAARRTADRWSDVEIMVFWSRPPGEAERREAAESADAMVRRCFAFDPGEEVWADDLSVGPDGVLVEVTHILVATAEEHLDRLLRQFDPDPLLLNFAQGVVDALPAHGSALLDGWKGRLAAYPEQPQLALCAAAPRSTTSAQRLEVAPPDFPARLRRSFALPAAEQAAALADLVGETYDLLERHIPAVDVARLHEIFQHARTAAGPSD